MMKVPVIFRAERSKHADVTAVFPTLPGTLDPGTFTVYAHVGQHSSGTLAWYRTTRRATPREYAALLAELQYIYSDVELIVVQRFTRRHDRERRTEIASA